MGRTHGHHLQGLFLKSFPRTFDCFLITSDLYGRLELTDKSNMMSSAAIAATAFEMNPIKTGECRSVVKRQKRINEMTNYIALCAIKFRVRWVLVIAQVVAA